MLGAAHVVGFWVHLPFMLAIGLLGAIRRSLRVVTVFTLGQIVGAVAALPMGGLDVVFAEITVGISAALIAREALREASERRRLTAVAALGGTVHGLSLGAMVADGLGGNTSGLVMQLPAVLGMDAGHIVGATLVAALSILAIGDRVGTAARRGLAYASGTAGVALALGLAWSVGVTGPVAAGLDVATQDPRLAAGATTSPASRRLAPAAPTAPIRSYLVIEPFEVRHEVMLRLGDLADELGLEPESVVEVAEQAGLSEWVATFVLECATVRADGEALPGAARRVDFMTVDATGAMPRATPVPENVREAVIGVVVGYPTEGMPREVSLTWDPFPSSISVLPATVIDPETVAAETLSADEPRVVWEYALAEDPVPSVAAVAVEPVWLPVPLLSLPLVAAAVGVLFVGLRRRRTEASMVTIRVLLALAIVVGPIARTTMALPAAASGTPSERQARRILAGLLPNVYRAMEFRDERMIYDRLAVSVTGETLTDIYLEQRRTLELEERGGAQARVETVEILDTRDIEKQDGGFRVRATWTVGGMVTHFGHRHFRQNRYDARIEIVPVDGQWKIRSVEILEQDRLK
jgi:hypothetical protein